MLATKEAGTTYLDLTERYPIISSRGNQYIFIFCDYETNSIQATLIKTRNAAEIQDATMPMLSTLTTSGNKPNIHILDNDVSSSLKQGFLKNNIKYQLVPLHPPRKNATKCEIQTSKAYFITCLCAVNPQYPTKEWDSFLPQETLNLNILRKYRFNPKLSSHAALHGIFD